MHQTSHQYRVIYTPQNRLVEKDGHTLSQWHLMWEELRLSQSLIWRWFLRDFKAKYKQTFLGWFWAVILPLFTVLIFVLMKGAGVIQFGDLNLPYPLYALTGLTIWGLFAAGMSNGSRALVDAGPMLVKINFPKSSLVIAASGQGLVDFMIKCILVGLVMAHYSIAPHPTGLFMAGIIAFFVYALALGISFFTSLVSGIVRDLPNVITLLTTLLMFLTPVLYEPRQESIMGHINSFNPLNFLVNGFRNTLFFGHYNYSVELLTSGFISIAFMLFGLRVFFVLHVRITERL